MKKNKLLTTPTRVSDMRFDDLYDDDLDWREKSARLQARRWRKLKQQLI